MEARAAEASGTTTSVGMRVFRDPQTGRITGKPGPAERAALQSAVVKQLGPSSSTSSQGLVQVASPVKGGGVMVDLQGRFRSTSSATEEAGATTVDCRANAPGTTTAGH
jgi:hypothetical protein